MAKHDHFDRLAKLLELEAAAEAQQLAQQARQQSGAAAERSGNCLVKLAIRDEQPAFGGRVVATLGKRDQTQSLPWNRFSVGTPVLLTEEGRAGESRGGQGRESGSRSTTLSWRGLVSRRDMSSLDVVLNESPEPENERPTF